MRKPCLCGKNPIFAMPGQVAKYCGQCKTEGMIDVVHKKCPCGKKPVFNLPGHRPPICCSKCKTENMIDVRHIKCPCGVRPSFGFPGQPVKSCIKCKVEGMVNTVSKKCVCGTHATFGFKGHQPTHCSKCKTEDMEDLRGRKCPCGTRANFGLPDTKPECCRKCKTDGMIDLVNKRCTCGTQVNFGLPGKKATHCSKCKLEGMIDVKNKRCISNLPPYNIMCPVKGNRNYKGFCTHCFANLFPDDPKTLSIKKKSKELNVVSFVNSQYEGFIHDKPLFTNECNCTHRRRVDLRKIVNGTLLCIEIDENQHKRYVSKDENQRYDDLFMMYSGKMVFIRYNPDKYKENGKTKNPSINTRYQKLKEEIDYQIQRIENEENVDLLEIIHIYYDNDVEKHVNFDCLFV